VGIVGITWQKAAERKSGGMLQVDRTSLRRSQGILARHFPVENRGVPQKKEKEAKKETKRLVETDVPTSPTTAAIHPNKGDCLSEWGAPPRRTAD
jgi:hypothetical protein